MNKRMLLITMLLLALLSVACAHAGMEEADWTLEEFVDLTDDGREIPYNTPTPAPSPTPSPAPESEPASPARADFIDRIISLGRQMYDAAGGKPQRAHYAGDNYICKNFTTYLFRKCRDDFRMEAYPKVQLVIPDNLPAEQCKPYYYGFLWKEVSAAKGNPFYVADQFIYDTGLSEQENLRLATEFMKGVQRGDFFQMSAQYSEGTGAHSAIIIADYDAQNNLVHWMDSNMLGVRRSGIRYGYVQFDATAEPEWWASTFCHKKRGATIYRLRDDIVYAADVK